MRRLRNSPPILCAVIAAVALAACGSSSTSSTTSAAPAAATSSSASPSTSSTSTTGSSSAGKAATGSPIQLGAVGSCGGALASGLGGVCPTIKAWADWVNANGGINGHPVKMTVLDDSGNPTTSLSDLKTLIQQDHVIALVGEYSVDDPAWIAYINSTGVPVIGGGSTEPPFVTSPNFYSSGAQVPAYEYAEAIVAKKHGDTKLGMMECAEAPTCASNAPLTQLMIKNGLLPGQKLVYVAKIAATSPSFTAQCLAAKAAGVQALLVADAGAIAQRVVDQCAQQGYKPLIMTGGGVLNPVLAKDPNFEGAIGTLTNPSIHAADAQTATLKQALAKYAPSLSPTSQQWNASIPSAWSGGLLFQAAAKAGNIGPSSTPADVKKALAMVQSNNLGGYSPPLSFKAGVITQVPCAYVESVHSGVLTTSQLGTSPICIPGGNTTPYMKLLQG